MAEELCSKKPKYLRDPLRFLGFLPGALPEINLHKKRFYKLLVRKGLVYMYDHGYDVDPDSPILRNDPDEEVPNGEEVPSSEAVVKFVVSVHYYIMFNSQCVMLYQGGGGGWLEK